MLNRFSGSRKKHLILMISVSIYLPVAAFGQEFLTYYAPSQDSVNQAFEEAFRQERVLEELAIGLNEVVNLPTDVVLSMGECGQPNAFYDPNERTIVMCYDLLSYFGELFSGTVPENEIGDAISGAFMFTFFHELGHALVDVLELPITGREEDAVDQLSATILLNGEIEDGASAVLDAANWFILQAGRDADAGQTMESMPFYDEHALNPTRFFNLVCWVYGSDPASYAGLVGELLPQERATLCADEFETFSAAWDRLLANHLRE